MRISDWSSDVCSSDLVRARLADRAVEHLPHQPLRAVRAETGVSEPAGRSTVSAQVPPAVLLPAGPASALCRLHHRLLGDAGDDAGAHAVFGRDDRSEEHTSELQSLMRISYAVFCLKKKKKNTKINNRHQK